MLQFHEWGFTLLQHKRENCQLSKKFAMFGACLRFCRTLVGNPDWQCTRREPRVLKISMILRSLTSAGVRGVGCIANPMPMNTEAPVPWGEKETSSTVEGGLF